MNSTIPDKNEVVLKVENVSKYFPRLRFRHDNLRSYFWDLLKKIPPEEKYMQQEKFCALQNINFEVKKGEFFGIIGKNGAGKSTLLKIIAGVYLPDTGRIHHIGKIIPFLELGVGFNYNLTARENVFLNGVILGMTIKEINENIEEIFDFAELTGFEELELKKYSSGMVVRLAFSIAAKAEGDIYLLDEVFSVGDIGFQKKALKKIEEMIMQKKTFIYVGHSMDVMRKYATNVLYLKDKTIKGIGLEMIDEYIKDQS